MSETILDQATGTEQAASRRVRTRTCQQAVLGEGADDDTDAPPYIGADVWVYRGTLQIPEREPLAAKITAIRGDKVNVTLFLPTGGVWPRAGLKYSPVPRAWHWTWPTISKE